MKKSAARIRKFVKDHKVAIAVTATSAVWLTMMVRNASAWNDFLKEHDLYDEYYFVEDEEPVEN